MLFSSPDHCGGHSCTYNFIQDFSGLDEYGGGDVNAGAERDHGPVDPARYNYGSR